MEKIDLNEYIIESDESDNEEICSDKSEEKPKEKPDEKNKKDLINRAIPYADLTNTCIKCNKEYSYKLFKICDEEMINVCDYCRTYDKTIREMNAFSLHPLNAVFHAKLNKIYKKREFQKEYILKENAKGIELYENDINYAKKIANIFLERLRELLKIETIDVSQKRVCSMCKHTYDMSNYAAKTRGGIKTGKFNNVCNNCVRHTIEYNKKIKCNIKDTQFQQWFDDYVVDMLDEEGDGTGKTYQNSDNQYKIDNITRVINISIPASIKCIQQHKSPSEAKIKIDELNINNDKLIKFLDALKTQPQNGESKCSKCHHVCAIDKFKLLKDGRHSKMCDKCRELTRKK
jgi:hypothetical protein